MKITFSINYYTYPGQKLYVSGTIPALGNSDKSKAPEMLFGENSEWSLAITIFGTKPFAYRYFVKNEQGDVIDEWGENRVFNQPETPGGYKMIDTWQNRPIDNPFYSSVFVKNLFSRKKEKKANPVSAPQEKLTLKVFAPRIEKHQALAISGNQKELNNWNPDNPILLDGTNFPEWKVDLDMSKLNFPLEFKFLITDKKTKSVVCWESGNNRIIGLTAKDKKSNVIISGLQFSGGAPNWKGAGVAIPVFSLRSEDSFGVGDFDDLKKMIDWAKSSGLKMIQILPINDTTLYHDWRDSYPYRAISAYAINPIYLSLKKSGELKDKKKITDFRKKQKELNKNSVVDYEAVSLAKQAYFLEIFGQEKEEVLKSKPFLAFFEKNKDWLIPYAAFCLFRDQYQTADFNAWGKYSKFDKKTIEDYCLKNIDQVSFYYYLQYEADKQLSEVAKYASEQGVVLKGDIPIGIGKESAEVWTDPELFNLSEQAGAPPDDFSATGQNWGFPTYNWDEMEKNGFKWWLKRFRKMSDFFKAYRIDHILGFFRIWEIPAHSVQGLLGQFNPALPFSRQELSDHYGLYLDENRYLKPYIRERFLSDFFGEYTEEAKQAFLREEAPQSYVLKEPVDTQRKVEAYFYGKDDTKSQCLKDGLFGLINEVLFVRDNKDPEKFHPRISAQFTYRYRELNDCQKQAFNRLYTDFFYNRHNYFWKEQALKKLPPLIDCSDMLVCAEDLGMIPQSVPDVINMLQILSLEIQRMPKDTKVEFGYPNHYPYLSVCTTSTHDMSTLREWWEENRDATQRYFNQMLGEPGAAPFYCEPWVCLKILMTHLYSPSMWAVFPLQDWFSIDNDLRRLDPREERINVPANPNHYWRYRMHITIEELMKNSDFGNKVKRMVEESGR